jgi:hypothetical protein
MSAHGGDAETFIGALVFDILDKLKLSLAKFCVISIVGRIISKDSIFGPHCLYRQCLCHTKTSYLQSILMSAMTFAQEFNKSKSYH